MAAGHPHPVGTLARRLTPRVVDWSLALCLGVAFVTGLMGNFTGSVAGRWVIVSHGIAGFVLALFVVPKLRRVWLRLFSPARWNGATVFGGGATLAVMLVVGTGVGWVAGGEWSVAGFNLLNWHITLGFALVAVVSIHMLARAKPLRRRDLTGRRQALRWLGLLAIGAVAWPLQARDTANIRRFTGSRLLGMDVDGTPNTDWPPTSWVADAPRPLDAASWHLMVTGHVATPLVLGYNEITGTDDCAATLDCTGGFATAQQWRGVRVGALLDRADVRPGAGWVRFRAVTGYRWSLPLADARAALIATHTCYPFAGGEATHEAVPLSHGHGGPARLVAPGRRGFEWVKWLVAVEVLTAPDPAEAIAIHTSSFTPAGRGEMPLPPLPP